MRTFAATILLLLAVTGALKLNKSQEGRCLRRPSSRV